MQKDFNSNFGEWQLLYEVKLIVPSLHANCMFSLGDFSGFLVLGLWYEFRLMCLQRGREASVPRLLPFKLGLILFCQKRLAGLPLTAHEWGEKVDPPNTGCVMHCNTAGNGIRQCLTFTSRALACTKEKKRKKTHLFSCVLLLEMAAAMCCSPDTPIAYNRVV